MPNVSQSAWDSASLGGAAPTHDKGLPGNPAWVILSA
jgi:hypothetical protein